MLETLLLIINEASPVWLGAFLLMATQPATARVEISAVEPATAQTAALRAAGSVATNQLSLRCTSELSNASFSVKVTSSSHAANKDILCDGTEYLFPLYSIGSSVYSGTAILYATNQSATAGTAIFEVHKYDGAWESANSETLEIPAARSCALSLPATVNLGSFTTEQIHNGVTSSQRIDMTGECNTDFSVLFSGSATPQADFMLGDDVSMALSYNYGADRIVNGQAFTPKPKQFIDIALASLNADTTPAPGSKTATLTVTLNLL